MPIWALAVILVFTFAMGMILGYMAGCKDWPPTMVENAVYPWQNTDTEE